MFTSSRSPHSITANRVTQVLLGALAINALVFSPLGDQGFPAIVLLGPLASGFVAAIRRADVRLVAAAWALSALFWLGLDWIVHDEDQVFHLVLAFLTAALTGLGAQLAHLARAIKRAAIPG